jgi:hypothetical protein
MTIFIGSAHSKFESNLPSGEKGRRLFMQPFTEEETLTWIQNDKSVFRYK